MAHYRAFVDGAWELAVSVALVHGLGAFSTGVFQNLLFRLESEIPDRSSGWCWSPQLMKYPITESGQI